MTTPILTALSLTLLLATHGPEGAGSSQSATPLPPPSQQSVGHPYSGSLKNAVKLSGTGPHHEIQRSTRARNWVFGTKYLIQGLIESAKAVDVAAPQGQPLVIGNLSRRKGGDISMSRSHNSGRDVDIAFYTVDIQGTSVPSLYHRFGRDGRSIEAPKKYQLDLPRNWAFVKALMVSKEMETQWVIVAPWIETLLLNYAASVGESSETINQAERMMMVPSWAKPHDNHFHIRVLCSPDDWKRGCDNGGPVWSWNTRMLTTLDSRKELHVEALSSKEAKTRIRAIQAIARRGISTAVSDIAPLLHDEDRKVRRSALSGLLRMSNAGTAPTLLKLARQCKPYTAYSLLETTLKHAGTPGLATAHEILENAHPVMKSSIQRKRKTKLKKLANKLVNRHRHLNNIHPGGPGTTH